ncbi:ABC transporter ATP-binding protein [Cryobacterium aureum]|uniref:ABC transporter ATP-binding protein n=1 Tax=Cryobacterium aureum TaxID=995037 RepID=UPI000CF573CE|nr:ABC transporter ATP-binding protein [Cryobacterium aureum]
MTDGIVFAQGARAATSGEGAFLGVKDLGVTFGGLTALSEYALELEQGRLLGIIGPNGAGKTTLFNLLTGLVPPTTGSVVLQGRDITGAKPHVLAGAGVARTFQNIRNIRGLSVIDNVKVALGLHEAPSLLSTIFYTPGYRAGQARTERKARDLLKLLNLDDVRDLPGDGLPYGAQRRLEIACALALEPKLLLLDEPAAGMNPTETLELMELIKRVHREFALTIMLIEHNVHFIMNTCERIQVLNYGRLIADGEPSYIRKHPAVIEAYLGAGAHDA